MDPALIAQAYPDTPSAWFEQQPECSQAAHVPGIDLPEAPTPQEVLD